MIIDKVCMPVDYRNYAKIIVQAKLQGESGKQIQIRAQGFT